MKLSEILNCAAWIIIATITGWLVVTNNPEFKLHEIGTLKVFYLALLNIATLSFLITLRGIREDAIDGLWLHPIGRAIFIAGYMIASGMVIGK